LALEYESTSKRQWHTIRGDRGYPVALTWRDGMASELPMEISRSVHVAIENHQAGRLAQAEALYRRILTIDSNNFDALHLLGVLAYQSGNHQEAVELISKAIRQDSTAFPAFNNLGLVEAVVAAQLNVIIYPEIGMDPMTMKVASLRLAPVQMAAWGHPETTGLSTIDYYLSAEDFEPPGGEQYYREQLILLPHLGSSYQRLGISPVSVDLNALGVDTELPLLICPGSAYKYAPSHDGVFVDIARGLKRCQFIFFNDEQENLSEKLRHRLTGAFEQTDLF